MTRTIAALALLTLAAGPALAQRASSTAMSCRAAGALVAQRGAVVLGTGRDTYDRFVASEGFCPTGTYGRPAFVPTRDNPQCNIGYYCSNSPPMFTR